MSDYNCEGLAPPEIIEACEKSFEDVLGVMLVTDKNYFTGLAEERKRINGSFFLTEDDKQEVGKWMKDNCIEQMLDWWRMNLKERLETRVLMKKGVI